MRRLVEVVGADLDDRAVAFAHQVAGVVVIVVAGEEVTAAPAVVVLLVVMATLLALGGGVAGGDGERAGAECSGGERNGEQLLGGRHDCYPSLSSPGRISSRRHPVSRVRTCIGV